MNVTQIIDKIDDNLNPLLVKEIKQIVRTKFFWVTLILILLFEALFVSTAFLGVTKSNLSGSDIMSMLFNALMFVVLGAIPIYQASRFSGERSERLDELLYTTTITPQQIIRGKFLAGMVFVLFAYGLCSPFIVLTFYLPGVDVASTFVLMFFSLCIACTVMMGFLCIASIRVGPAVRRGLQVVGAFFLLTQYFSFFGMFMRSTFLIDFSSPQVIKDGCLYLAHMGIITYFLYGVASAIISPEGSNKMFWIRTRGLLVIIITFLINVALFGSGNLGVWFGIVLVTLSFKLFVVVSEPTPMTTRIKREVPKNAIAKFLSFPFFTGPLNGISYCVLVAFSSLVVFQYFDTHPFRGRELFTASNFFQSFLFYALLASLLVRTILVNRVKASATWGVATILLVFGTFGSVFVGQMRHYRFEALFPILNPLFAVSYSADDVSFLSLFLLLLLTFLNLRWFIKQIVEYKNAN